jgi:hypothetical protein
VSPTQLLACLKNNSAFPPLLFDRRGHRWFGRTGARFPPPYSTDSTEDGLVSIAAAFELATPDRRRVTRRAEHAENRNLMSKAAQRAASFARTVDLFSSGAPLFRNFIAPRPYH